MRATVSPAFPAVNGLITLIGLAGQVSALAATVAIERATAAKKADNARIDIMFYSRKSLTPRWLGAAAMATHAEAAALFPLYRWWPVVRAAPCSLKQLSPSPPRVAYRRSHSAFPWYQGTAGRGPRMPPSSLRVSRRAHPRRGSR